MSKFRLIKQEKINGWHMMSAYEPESNGYTWTAWAKKTAFVDSPPSLEEAREGYFFFGHSREEAVGCIVDCLEYR